MDERIKVKAANYKPPAIDNKVNINWNYILLALNYKIESLKQQVLMCNCCEQHMHKLQDYENELEIYKAEYKKVLIEQQKSNKCQ